MNLIKNKFMESLKSVLPIALIVLALSITIVPISTGDMFLFLFGVVCLVFGMSLFTAVIYRFDLARSVVYVLRNDADLVSVYVITAGRVFMRGHAAIINILSRCRIRDRRGLILGIGCCRLRFRRFEYLRRQLGSNLKLRYAPEIVWALDDSITYGAKMLALINSLEVRHDDDEESDQG